jgi:hypothetical protein
VSVVDSPTLNTTIEFKKALSFLYSYEMTMFNNVDEFAPTRTLTREEAAKLFTNFAMNVLCRTSDTSVSLDYKDMGGANDTLKPYIVKAYQL